MKYEAIVVGGGYFGCSISYHLAMAGVKTLLIEKGEVISGASGANFGCVQVADSNPGLSLELTIHGFNRMQKMEKELGRDIGFRFQDTIIGAETEHRVHILENNYREVKAAGLDIKWLGPKEVLEAEPNLVPGAVLAATSFTQGKIYPFHYMYALLARGKEHGLKIRERSTVAELLTEGGRVTGVCLADGGTIRAEHVILSTGAWTKELCAPLGLQVPVECVKSEAFVSEAIAPFLNAVYSSAGFFEEAHNPDGAATSFTVAQSQYGNLLIGETSKPFGVVAEDARDRTSLDAIREIRKLIPEYFPAMADINIIRSWVVPSPYTDSCLPVLGEVEIPGLILAAGFKSASVMTPAAGEIVRDLVKTGSCAYDLSEFTGQVKRAE